MIPKYRKQFNEEYSSEKYQLTQDKITANAGVETGFRLSESPVFLSKAFKDKLDEACKGIVEQIKKIPEDVFAKAIPEHCNVPNDNAKPHFLAIDFGICKNNEGEIVPQLIELQAFPTLYAFQEEYEGVISEVYPFLQDLRNSMPKPKYVQFLKDVIVGDENPENVILLEIYPEKQKTSVDFALTEKYLGIKTVCLTKIIKEGQSLFYENEGKKVLIKRIYNRVIFDELEKMPDLKTNFDFRADVDVKWITHPNWFFKISKYIMPLLEHTSVPKSYFVPDFPSSEDLEEYVLKPLFSFAGSGVNLHPTEEIIAEIKDKENFILQKKVHYEPLFEDIKGEMSKAEIRMLFLWKEEDATPTLMDNLVRMTKVAMVNVDFNKKDAIWIGSSIGFFEK